MSSLKILLVGDVVIGEPLEKNFIGDDFKAVIAEHNIISCNFEAPIVPLNATAIQKAGPHVYQHNSAVQELVNAGFNLFSLANNHIYDYGYEALQHTLETLDSQDYIGAGITFEVAYQPKVIEKNGISVAFFSFAEWGFGAITDGAALYGGYAWVNHEMVNVSITEAKKHCDFVVVQVHAGVEEVNIPLPEWRRRYKELIDYGADAIVGHHPHVPQGWEKYEKGLICYSLGNFFFDAASTHKHWHVGYAVSLTLEKDGVLAFEIIPTQNSNRQIVINTDKLYRDHLKYINSILASEVYTAKVNAEVLQLWKKVYSPYYRYASNGIDSKGSPYELLRLAYRWIFKKNTVSQHLLLLHNLKIESHRFAVERALQLMIDKR